MREALFLAFLVLWLGACASSSPPVSPPSRVDQLSAVPTATAPATRPTPIATWVQGGSTGRLQPTPVATPSQSTQVYVVQRGDTMYSIARRYGTTVQAIAALNGLQDPTSIYVGQRLLIPGAP